MDKRICPVCDKEVDREVMSMTHDYYGIPFRLVCNDCWDFIMNTKGYDGQYYSESDENIDDNY